MKRTRRGPPKPHDRHENLPRPHVVLKLPAGAGEQMHGQDLEEKALAAGEIAAALPAEASSARQAEARPQETADRCPCIRAYSALLVRLPGGALRVAFFKGEEVKPRRVQGGHE